MTDISKLRKDVNTVETRLKELEKQIAELTDTISKEPAKYGTNAKANKELADRISALQNRYDINFVDWLNLASQLETAEKQSRGNVFQQQHNK